MRFSLYENLTINTALSPDEVRVRLLDVTSLNSTQYREDKMFRGEIKNSSFEIYRMFKGRNSFAALAKGKIQQDPNGSGSIIEIKMGPPNSSRIVFNLIKGVVFFLFSFQLLAGILTRDLSVILITVAGGAFFYLFFTQGFKVGKARIRAELQELLQV